jgi:hypothetical protein
MSSASGRLRASRVAGVARCQSWTDMALPLGARLGGVRCLLCTGPHLPRYAEMSRAVQGAQGAVHGQMFEKRRQTSTSAREHRPRAARTPTYTLQHTHHYCTVLIIKVYRSIERPSKAKQTRIGRQNTLISFSAAPTSHLSQAFGPIKDSASFVNPIRLTTLKPRFPK